MRLGWGNDPLKRARQTSCKLLILQAFHPEASADGVVRPEGLEPPTPGSEDPPSTSDTESEQE